jgi:glycosyltransferase involved in cell wall biosynthesis
MSEEKLVTFVIPSVARDTLTRSINSLLAQTSDNWRAIVGFDGIKKEQINFDLLEDERIQYLFLEKTGQLKDASRKHSKAGQVRNKIIEHVETKWIAFLDDDDTVDREYVYILSKEDEKEDMNCFIFRMKAANGDVIPFSGSKQIRVGQVGISFCVKADFIKQKSILFNNSETEDYEMIKSISSSGGRIKLLEQVGYYVGGKL